MDIINWVGRRLSVVIILVMIMGALVGRMESFLGDLGPMGAAFFGVLEAIGLLFMAIFLQSLPFLLLGALASGVVGNLVESQRLFKFLPESPLGQIGWGALSGLWLPVGETGTIPLARQFWQMGFPNRFTAALLVAAPIVNPITIASLWAVFGFGTIIFGCVFIALVAALVTGLVVDKRTGSRSPQMPIGHENITPDDGHTPRFQKAAVEVADLFFETGQWLTLGALASAIIMVIFMPGRLLSGEHEGISWVMTSGVLGILRSHEASSAPFALIPMIGLLPKSAMISAIVLGSQISVKRIILLRSVFAGREWLEMVLIPASTSLVMVAGLVVFLHW